MCSSPEAGEWQVVIHNLPAKILTKASLRHSVPYRFGAGSEKPELALLEGDDGSGLVLKDAETRDRDFLALQSEGLPASWLRWIPKGVHHSSRQSRRGRLVGYRF